MRAYEIDVATRRLEHNIQRFYLYKFLLNLQLWLPIWIIYLQRERGLSLTQITAMEVPFQLVGVAAQIPTGALADRWGRKRSLVLGAVGLGAGYALFGLAANYAWILVSYVVWSLALALCSGADSAFLHDTLAALGREQEFGRIVGRGQAWYVGAGLLATLIGAPLAAATSLDTPILVSAGVTLLAALVVLGFHEPERRAGVRQLSYAAVMRGASIACLRHPPLRAMIAVSLTVMSLSATGFVFLQQPFLALHHVPVRAFGVMTAPVQACSVAGFLLSARLTARCGERRLLYALTAGVALSLLVPGAVPSLLAAGAFLSLRFCSSSLYPLASTVINRHSPDELRATIASAGAMASGLGIAVAAPVLGFVADRFSLPAAFLVAAATAGLLGLISLAAWTAALRGSRFLHA